MGVYLDKQILFIFLVPIWIIIRIILFYYNKKRGTNFSLKKEAVLNIFFIYILCLLSVTLFPLIIGFGERNNWISVNLIPIIGTAKEVSNITSNPNMQNFMIKFWIKNIFGNMLLLLPLGVMMPILWKQFDSLKKLILFAFCISLSIETLQLLSGFIGNMGRAFDIDDILLNTVGAFIGFVLYDRFVKSRKKLV